jgi:hypothetical protein
MRRCVERWKSRGRRHEKRASENFLYGRQRRKAWVERRVAKPKRIEPPIQNEKSVEDKTKSRSTLDVIRCALGVHLLYIAVGLCSYNAKASKCYEPGTGGLEDVVHDVVCTS